MLDTLKYAVHETHVWTEITTLLIPGENDSEEEIEALTSWIARELRRDVPLHFTAFHPDYRMLDVAPTPSATLQKARCIGPKNGLRHVYVGNVQDPARQATLCPTCGLRCIGRDGYKITTYELDAEGACKGCGTKLAGVFADKPGQWAAPPAGRDRALRGVRGGGGAEALGGFLFSDASIWSWAVPAVGWGRDGEQHAADRGTSKGGTPATTLRSGVAALAALVAPRFVVEARQRSFILARADDVSGPNSASAGLSKASTAH